MVDEKYLGSLLSFSHNSGRPFPTLLRHFLPQQPRKMAAPCSSEFPSEASSLLKIPKTEVLSPESPGLSDGNRSVSNPSTPGRGSPLQALGSGGGSAAGGLGAASSPSVSFTACRGMSWTPAETNALIAVWGNERLVEARYQQLEGAGTVFGSKAPGPAMYERVSRALAELGYERTPSQCRERMKKTPYKVLFSVWITLRRCYSRVKEHGIGKRKSSYTFEQLEQVFGQGGWDSQPCQPVLINSSGLYQEMESDSSTMEDYSQEDWGNHSQELPSVHAVEQDLDEIPAPKRPMKMKPESSEDTQGCEHCFHSMLNPIQPRLHEANPGSELEIVHKAVHNTASESLG
ncbi:myb/SANT-like DNA-binding domain-containing protein 2 isoform X3 [Rhinatrema bivittatum]|uniref:myb/SANT-like DNA-binding domain-containing protein 2 isoform X3 n=1 Tax=Rhinatrema bivittatum TaxID=194408 RepID=UPI001126851A|nr:myb/SANT-like DNA-binding domain-containing protein 2 isoform X3 [Rhinatrema bivittatum]